MLEGKVITNRQADYLSTIESACMAAKCLAGKLISDFPMKTEASTYFVENFDDTFETLNAVHSLLECVVGIFDSREF